MRAVVAGGLVATAWAGRVRAAEPAADDAAAVDRLVGQLAATDAGQRSLAEGELDDLPAGDLPLLRAAAGRAAAGRAGLTGEAAERLAGVVKRAESAAKAREAAWAKRDAGNKWRAALLRKDYDRNRKKGAATWDVDVYEAFSLAGEPLPGPRSARVDRAKRIVELLDGATEAGCTDPTVYCVKAMALADAGEGRVAVAKTFDKAAAAFSGRDLSPYVKVYVDDKLLRAACVGLNGGLQKTWPLVKSRYAEAQHLTRTVLEDRKVPRAVALDAYRELLSMGMTLKVPSKAVFDWGYEPLKARLHNDPALLTQRGEFEISWAWEARGGGYGDAVTDQGWKDFGDRLDAADADLRAAYAADPDDPRTPSLMVTATIGKGNDAAERDRWFDRAVAADPECRDGYEAELTGLLPQWGGSAEAAVAFGRRCAAEGRWRTGVPLVLASAHKHLADVSGDPAAYVRRPGVWAELDRLYAEALARYPGDDLARSEHARFAGLAGELTVADAEFKRLGDRLDPIPFGTDAVADQARKAAAAAGK